MTGALTEASASKSYKGFSVSTRKLVVQQTIAGDGSTVVHVYSGFIAVAEKEAPEYVDALSERKVKICKLIPELMLLNNQNVELLKHGIIISNKMLETIIDAFAPQGCNYNGAGKTDSQEYDLWTINEEI